MKKIIIIVAVLVVGVLGTSFGKVFKDTFLENSKVVVNNIPETIIKPVIEDALEVRINEAKKEAQEEIETKARTQYEKDVAEAQARHDGFIETEYTKVSDKVKEEYIAEIEATISSTAY